jgi:hypothetical protein
MSKTPKLTTRAVSLAVGMLLLASCGIDPDVQPDQSVKTLHIPSGMTEIGIHVQPTSVIDGDHVDVLMMDEGQETIMLQNVEVLAYDRKENLVWLVVTKEDADRVMQGVTPQQFRLISLPVSDYVGGAAKTP